MSNVRSIDMLLRDDVFDRSGGYVLNFSDAPIIRHQRRGVRTTRLGRPRDNRSSACFLTEACTS